MEARPHRHCLDVLHRRSPQLYPHTLQRLQPICTSVRACSHINSSVNNGSSATQGSGSRDVRAHYITSAEDASKHAAKQGSTPCASATSSTGRAQHGAYAPYADAASRSSKPPSLLEAAAAAAALAGNGQQQLQVLKATDGNAVTAAVAYALSDVAFIYPITPATPMSEAVDQWAADGRVNLLGNVVQVTELEGEAGVAGALHGCLHAGALSTTFTCSQGLLLMTPNMYKIAGALLPCVVHVAARTLASDAMSMYCDHQDVMAVRQTGWAMLSSANAQEAQDLALVAHLATLKASVPFLHFFDGILTSHEMRKVWVLNPEAYRPLLQAPAVAGAIKRHRAKALNPSHPHQRGGAQGSDVLMQMWEGVNPYYQATPEIVQQTMADVSALTGRPYHLFGYYGHPEADRVVVCMGSGTSVLEEAADYLNQQSQKVGVVKVHLFRPWSLQHFLAALPASATKVAVLDRTKECGSCGEPLYLDVMASVGQAMAAGGPVRRVVGGRYGLGGKPFTPAMAVAVFDNLAAEQPKDHFTVGITDDVTMTSLPVGPEIDTLPDGTYECIFWGMGSDGTVGANKEAIKIIGDADQDAYVQASFHYDAHKSGALTISHLRFGPSPIRGSYSINKADYMGVHKAGYLAKFDVLSKLKPGGVLVVNAPWTSAEDMAAALPAHVLRRLAALQPQLYVVAARAVADAVGLGKRINMVMQAVFFQTSGVLQLDKAIPLLKASISKSYGKQGEAVVAQNHAAVDAALSAVAHINIPPAWATASDGPPAAAAGTLAPSAAAARAAAERLGLHDFAERVVQPMLTLQADGLPVSAFMPGNVMPPGTTQLEQRTTASRVPLWEAAACTQCNICAFICPHAAIRPVIATEEELSGAATAAGVQSTFKTLPLKGLPGSANPSSSTSPRSNTAEAVQPQYSYRVQVAPHDCTGCSLCAAACSSAALTMLPRAELLPVEAPNWSFAKALPSRGHLFDRASVRGSQFQQPLLEFSGACEGCGETAYVKLLTQMFGERMVIANACGCSSVWGGWEPSNPYTVTPEGRGPAWATSLLEDNAQFGFGIYSGLKQRRGAYAAAVQALLADAAGPGSTQLRAALQAWLQVADNGLLCHGATEQLLPLLSAEGGCADAPAALAVLHEDGHDLLEKPSCWIVGGDGWAYDIGFGGLDHVLQSKADVNILVLDTEGYSNTGGQQSKATPLGAVLSCGAAGKSTSKKDLACMMMQAYGQDIYVASVCLEANYSQVVKAFAEAEAHQGVSLIVAYAPCVMHGLRDGMKCSAAEARAAVELGYWPLYRYTPPAALPPHVTAAAAAAAAVADSGTAAAGAETAAAAAAQHGRLVLDSKSLKGELEEFLAKQNRFAILSRRQPEVAAELHQQLQDDIRSRHDKLRDLAGSS